MFLGKMTCAGIGMIAAFGLSTSIASAQQSVEVLHWWTAGGEAKALQVLKKDLEDQGVSWNDMPVAGGGGEQAMTVLRARVTSGNAPTAVQMLGFDIKDWAGEGVLGNLDDLASKEGWEEVVPDALKEFSKYDGHWIAAPVNVHSTNWVWANKAIFDAVVMATGGPEFYQASMIDTDPDALGSDTMKTVFDRMAKLRTYVDDNFSGRDWNLATAMVINKEAGVQFMGDWAKGEFLNAGKVPDTDFMCFRFPGTQDAVTFNSDQFVMFQVGEDRQDAQMKLASAVMSPSFQSAFNVVKGSVPARTDVPNDDFDACGKKGMAELAAANEKGTLFGSMAHGHSVPAGVKNAMYDVITAHFNGEYDSAAAVEELVNAVESAQ